MTQRSETTDPQPGETPAAGFVFTAADYPRQPGVYLMHDARGVVLYVGKANSIRTRLRSYFRDDADGRYQIRPLLRRLAAIETIVTATEKEALLLEHTLIRKHRPRYNIWFRDDKSYSSIKITGHEFPAVFRTRKVRKDGAEYFGPYTSAAACRETVAMLTKFFQLRTCSDREFANRARPCLQYQIGQCTAPCVQYVDAETYAAQVARARLLLQGKHTELNAHLEAAMQKSAVAERYEEAARYRDLLADIAKTIEPQHVVRHQAESRDYVAWAEHEGRGAVVVLQVVDGKVESSQGAAVSLSVADPAECIASFLLQYYQAPRVPPRELALPKDCELPSDVTAVLFERRGGKLKLKFPQRGPHAKLMRIAADNARALCERSNAQDASWESIAARLQKVLKLPEEMHSIECVDISNWQGKEAVGSLVAFVDGESAKERYRHFVIRGAHEPNDYEMMREVLSRRLQSESAPPRPDVLMVDGGKGQLGVACRVLQDLSIDDQIVIGIAKPREDEDADKVYLPGRKNPVALKKGQPALLFLQRVRDEAHRFAITHQRKRQRKRMRGDS